MAKRFTGVLAVLLVLATISVCAQSRALVSTLTTLRSLSDDSFQQVVWWSSNPSDPNITVPDWNNAEHQIMQLKHKDRDAVIAWLSGKGRQALYARGATDKQIGPSRINDNGSSGSSSTVPLTNYRIMPLSSPTLDATTTGNIQVTGGFALIKKDATMAAICLSFINHAPQVASSVQFAFALMDKQGDTLTTLPFTRTGTFSPNVAINGPRDANSYLNGAFGPRGAYDNCLVLKPGMAALPLAQARFVSYKVTAVHYANGSRWP
jgi:hypothetical protein